MVQSVIILNSRNGWNSAAEHPKCLLISRSQLQFLLFDSLWSSIPFPNWPFSQKLSSAQDTAHYWAFFSPKTICLTFSPLNILSCHKRVPSPPLTWASCCLVHPLFPHFTSGFLNYLLFLKLSASPFYRIFPSLFLDIYGLPSVWEKKKKLLNPDGPSSYCTTFFLLPPSSFADECFTPINSCSLASSPTTIQNALFNLMQDFWSIKWKSFSKFLFPLTKDRFLRFRAPYTKL